MARQQSYDRISQERSRRPDWSRRLLRRRLDRGRLPQRCHRSATNAIAGIATTDRPGPDHPRGSSRRVWAPITYPTPLRACQGEHSSALAGQVPQYAANGVLGAARAAPRPRTLGCGRERKSRPDCRTGDGAAATSAGLGPRGRSDSRDRADRFVGCALPPGACVPMHTMRSAIGVELLVVVPSRHVVALGGPPQPRDCGSVPGLSFRGR